MFLGGGSLFPFPPLSEFPKSILGSTYFSYALVNALEIGVFAGKVTLFIFLMFWVRATLPRMRVDRLMNFAWKYLVPMSIANIVIAAVWFELVLRPGLPLTTSRYLSNGVVNWLIGWLVTGPITLLTVWFVIWFNKRSAHGDGRSAVGDTRPESHPHGRGAVSLRLRPRTLGILTDSLPPSAFCIRFSRMGEASRAPVAVRGHRRDRPVGGLGHSVGAQPRPRGRSS